MLLTGAACAVVGVFGFSFKAVLIKLAYAAYPVDALTLLTLRMLYSAPLLCAMAWWASSRPGIVPIGRKDVLRLVWFGFTGYYLASLLDFTGLQYITASLERLVLYLYPTLVVILSSLLLRERITRRTVGALLISYAGIALAFWNDLKFATDAAATMLGSALVFVSATLYALYLVQAGDIIARLGSTRFIAWAMLASAVFVFAQFCATRPIAALDVPMRVHAIALVIAVVSTVLPVWLIAESIRRLGANLSSLIGALGPVFTIGLGAMMLGEPIEGLQLAGAALVLAGVLLVTLQATRGSRPLPVDGIE